MTSLTAPQQEIFEHPARFRVVSRKVAKDLCLKTYCTGKPCLRGHYSERYVSNFRCLECLKMEEIKKRKAESDRKYREKNKDKKSEMDRRYRENNKDKIRESKRKYEKENRDRLLPGKNARSAERRANKLNATPHWYSEYDALVFQEMSQHCRDLYNIYKVKFNIDHIIPLQNDLVCGLHSANNWQILTRESNLAKSNKFDPEKEVMPCPV